MKNRAIAIIMVVAAFGSDFCLPASAQSHWRSQKANSTCRPGEANVPRRPGETNFPCRPGEANRPPKPTPVVSAAKPAAPVVPVSKPASAAVAPSPSKCRAPCVAKRSAITEADLTREAGERRHRRYIRMPLARMASASSAAGPLRGSSRTEQHELDGAEIGQTVTARDFGKARRDQLAWENRDA